MNDIKGALLIKYYILKYGTQYVSSLLVAKGVAGGVVAKGACCTLP